MHPTQRFVERTAVDVPQPLAQVAQQRAGVEAAPGEFEVGLADAGAQRVVVAGERRWAWMRWDCGCNPEFGSRLVAYAAVRPQKFDHRYVASVQKNRQARQPSLQDRCGSLRLSRH